MTIFNCLSERELTSVCPFCGSHKTSPSVLRPFSYESTEFYYVNCNSCELVFLQPFPSNEILDSLYSPEYHQKFYLNEPSTYFTRKGFKTNLDLIQRYTNVNASILDYGCGSGFFLSRLLSAGYFASGVEYNEDACAFISSSLSCHVYSHASNDCLGDRHWDVIHMSDVLEHLLHPKAVLSELGSLLSTGGVFVLSGPLENNNSIVFLSIWISSLISRILRHRKPVKGVPYHLFRANAKNQRALLSSALPDFDILEFKTFESGWPLGESKSYIARLIAFVSLQLYSLLPSSFYYGNRFVSVLRKR